MASLGSWKTIDAGAAGAVLLVVFFAGCDRRSEEPIAPEPAPSAPPTTRVLELPGVKVDVPLSFEPVDAAVVEQVKAGGLAYEPQARLDVAGMHGKDERRDGGVFVQHAVTASRQSSTPVTAQTVLDYEIKRTKELMSQPPMELLEYDVKRQDDRLAVRAKARITARGVEVQTMTSLVMYVDPEHHIVMLGAFCTADSATADNVCTPVLASMKTEPGERVPLDTTIPALP
ncbi:MAG: hypothetical protein HOW73_11815 [Polyangiaceae bacterium]|nr:hypothetical protein [Polyangiaceae bacterium]